MTEVNTPMLRKLVELAEAEEDRRPDERGDVYWYQDKWAKQSFPERDAVAELVGAFPFTLRDGTTTTTPSTVWRIRGAKGTCKTGCCIAGNAALWSGAEFVIPGDQELAESTAYQANLGYVVSYEYCLTPDGRLMSISQYADEVLGIRELRDQMEGLLGGNLYHAHNKAHDIRHYAEAYAGESL